MTLSGNTVVNIALTPDDYWLKGIEIVGSRKHSGQFALEAKEIQALPSVGGTGFDEVIAVSARSAEWQ